MNRTIHCPMCKGEMSVAESAFERAMTVVCPECGGAFALGQPKTSKSGLRPKPEQDLPALKPAIPTPPRAPSPPPMPVQPEDLTLSLPTPPGIRQDLTLSLPLPDNFFAPKPPPPPVEVEIVEDDDSPRRSRPSLRKSSEHQAYPTINRRSAGVSNPKLRSVRRSRRAVDSPAFWISIGVGIVALVVFAIILHRNAESITSSASGLVRGITGGAAEGYITDDWSAIVTVELSKIRKSEMFRDVDLARYMFWGTDSERANKFADDVECVHIVGRSRDLHLIVIELARSFKSTHAAKEFKESERYNGVPISREQRIFAAQPHDRILLLAPDKATLYGAIDHAKSGKRTKLKVPAGADIAVRVNLKQMPSAVPPELASIEFFNMHATFTDPTKLVVSAEFAEKAAAKEVLRQIDEARNKIKPLLASLRSSGSLNAGSPEEAILTKLVESPLNVDGSKISVTLMLDKSIVMKSDPSRTFADFAKSAVFLDAGASSSRTGTTSSALAPTHDPGKSPASGASAFGEAIPPPLKGPATVAVTVTNVTSGVLSDSVQAHLLDLVTDEDRSYDFSWTNETLKANLSPVADFEKFVAAIQFGTVVKSDAAARTVEIKVDPSKIKLRRPAPPQRELPNGKLSSAELAGIVNGLKAASNSEISEALRKLIDSAPVASHRAEIAKLLDNLSQSIDRTIAVDAAQALGHWATEENIPTLLKLIEDKEVRVCNAAMDALADLKDERGALPIAAMLESSERDHASRALQRMGSVAEKAVCELIWSDDVAVQKEVCKILRVIGTKYSIEALESVARLYPKLKSECDDTIAIIRANL